MAELISKMLDQHYSTEVVTHGMWAVRRLRSLLPDIIIVEVEVPGDGIRLAELVGISPKFNTVPLILTCAAPTADMAMRARNAVVMRCRNCGEVRRLNGRCYLVIYRGLVPQIPLLSGMAPQHLTSPGFLLFNPPVGGIELPHQWHPALHIPSERIIFPSTCVLAS